MFPQIKMKDRNTIKWDEVNSFYRWKIYFTNGRDITGYSKKKDEPEVQDKVKLFQRCLIRLKKPQEATGKYPAKPYGYFTHGQIERIDFFRRTNLGEYKEKLVTFTPLVYDLSNNINFNTNETIQKFLSVFYALLKSGEITKLDYSGIGYSKIDEDKCFSLTIGRFKNVMELQNYGNDLIIQGKMPERVYHFIRQYKEIIENASYTSKKAC